MRPKSLILLSLALGCGLIASLGINQVMSKGTAPVDASDETEAIYVALTEINITDSVTPEMVKLEQWPKNRIPEGAIRKLENLTERKPRQKLFPGEPLLEAKLLTKGESHTFTRHIPDGFRVVAVSVNASTSGGYLVKPGDRVDLLIHLQRNSSAGVPRTITKTFLQDVKVFAVDSTIQDDKGEGAMSAKTVSLLVKPAESELVTYAAHMGKITLSLRPPGEESQTLTPGADATALFQPSGRRNDSVRDGLAAFTGLGGDSGDNSGNPLFNLIKGVINNKDQAEQGDAWQPEPLDEAFMMTIYEAGEPREFELRGGQMVIHEDAIEDRDEGPLGGSLLDLLSSPPSDNAGSDKKRDTPVSDD